VVNNSPRDRLESSYAAQTATSLISLAEIQRRKIWRWGLAYLAGAWALLQVVDLVGDRFGLPDVWLRWLIVLIGIGFFVTLIFCWYRGERAARRMSALEIGLLTGLFAVAGSALYWVLASDDPETATAVNRSAGEAASEERAQAPTASLAVLPFENLSSDAQQEYFSDGLTEELLNVLAQIPELRVAARTSAFAFKGKRETIDVIAQTLRVAHILEGTVRKAGNRIRITVQLIDAASGFRQWTNTYESDLVDVFAVQDEISRAIVEELRVHVGQPPGAISRTTNPEAYSLYLQGTQALRKSGAPSDYLAEAAGLFQRALAIDPDYPAALSGMAETLRAQAYGSLIPAHEGYERARKYAERALQLNPEDAVAHAELGIISDWVARDYVRAEQHYQRALELNSSASRTRSYYGWLLMRTGRLEAALREASRAVDVDPLSITARTNHASLLQYARRYDHAVTEYNAALALDPNDVITASNLALTHALIGNAQEAIVLAERALALDPDLAFAQAIAGYSYGVAGRYADAESVLRSLRNRQDAKPYLLATVSAGMGDREQAFRFLSQALDENDDMVVDLGMDPVFDWLREDSRMQELLARLKLTQTPN
jgi:adenylate cyclase